MAHQKNSQKILLFGATGLVGRTFLQKLVLRSAETQINVLARRELPSELKNQQVVEFKMNFDAIDENSECFKSDTVVCAIGTTIKAAGSQEKFRLVDYAYPLQIAKIAKQNGAQHFFLISALGADPHSSVFYNRTKGELEVALQQLGFKSLVIIRPSILVGEREESRPLEKVGQIMGQFLPKTWRAVPAENIAEKIISLLASPPTGLHVVENKDLF